MLVDTHVHIWEQDSNNYPWKPVGNLRPNFAFGIAEQTALMDKHKIDCGIIIQTSWYGYNNRYIIDAMKTDPIRFQSIGMINPESVDVVDEIDKLLDMGISGFRLAPMLRPDIHWYGTPKSERFWNKADKHGLIFTLLVDLPQLVDLEDTIRRYPNVISVIDHMAHPEKETDPDHPLFRQMLKMADIPNLFVKISALGVMSQQPFPHLDMIDYGRQTIDAFGPSRCMWGTDHALSRHICDMNAALECLDQLTKDLSEEEKEQIRGLCAAKLWKLDAKTI